MKEPGAGGSQAARATLALRQLLLQGRFRPGERLREIPLAAELHVSRIPLRLALERLAHEGLLGIRRTRGFIVQQFSAEDIFDAIELRGTLEGVAARLAAERLRDAGDLAAMHKLDREMRNAVEGRGLTLQRFSRYVDLNAEFHAGLLALARSRLLGARHGTSVQLTIRIAQRFPAAALCLHRFPRIAADRARSSPADLAGHRDARGGTR